MSIVNQQFGKYHLRKRIASGGMAEIFLGRFEGAAGFSKTLVIKRILPHFSRDAEFVSMLIDEACLAAELTHPNVVHVYDFGSVEDIYFIAMEYVDGVDLRTLLGEMVRRGDSLRPVEVAKIGEGIAAGLHFAHTACDDSGAPLEIIHRDVSPHNILLSYSGEVKIADFGIARARDRATQTATGAIKGKVAYMAPEQIGALELDPRVDQFALGVVLWECLTGERLFGEGSGLDVMRRVMEGDIPHLGNRAEGIPGRLCDVVHRMLSRDREERFPNMATVAAELGAFRFSLGEAGQVDLGVRVGGLDLPRSREKDASESGSRNSTLVLDADDGVEASVLAPARPGGTAPLETQPFTRGEGESSLPPTLSFAGPVDVSSDKNLGTKGSEPEEGAGKRRVWWMAALGLCLGIWLTIDSLGLKQMSPTPSEGPAPIRERMDPGLIPERSPLGKGTPTEELSFEAEGSQRPDVREAVVPVPPEKVTIGRESKKLRKVEGRLHLRVIGGWAKVYWKGRLLGTTPLSDLIMPEGEHELELRNPTLGLEKRIRITVKEGRATRRAVRIE